MGQVDDECYGEEYLQDILAHRLLDLNGREFLDQVHDEAAAWVDGMFPWNGHGPEPGVRVDAYLAVLRQQRTKQEHQQKGGRRIR